VRTPLTISLINGAAATSFGWAWLAATTALAVHVIDEATHDFLAWYNPRALQIRQWLRGFPFPPTFTFLPWVLGLAAGVTVLVLLTPAAYQGKLWLRPVGYIVAGIHIGNGLLHLLASVIMRRRVPGVLSAPLLLVSGAWLAYAAATLN
jgi:hypothetical protein